MSTMALGDICEVTAGQSAPQDPSIFGVKGKPFIRAGSLEKLLNGGAEEDCELISDENAVRQRLRLFPEDTILFAKSGMSAKIGRVYRLRTPSYVVSHLAAVISGPKVDPSYLQRWFEKYPPSRLIPNEAYPSIRTSEISQLKIDLPPLVEQKRIAAILDKADAVCRKRQQAIKLADDFLRATFLDMFGDPVTNPKSMPLEPLESIVTNLIRGPFGSALKKEFFVPSGYKVYEQKHAISGDFNIGSYYIDEDKYEEMKRFSISPGDLIISCSGTIGRVAIVPESAKPGIINQALLKIVPNQSKASPIYLKAVLESGSIQKVLYGFSHGSGLQNFPPMEEIRALQIPVPTIEQLEMYHQLIKQHRSYTVKIKKLSDSSEVLFFSLTQRAFRGEL
jgi:type I restriction enzyme S subunit